MEPLKIVLASFGCLVVNKSAFLTTVDDIDCRAEALRKVSTQVSSIRFVVASHNIVHTWFWILRRHIEPNASCKGQEAILLKYLWIFKQVHFTVVAAWCEGSGESSVVVVPRELERTPTIILLPRLGRPSLACPAILLVVTSWVVSSIASDLLHPIKTLSPKLAVAGISFASLLTPMSKESSKFSLTSLLYRLVSNISLIAEARELADSLQEVFISIEWISKAETLFKLLLRKESLNPLYIWQKSVIVVNRAISRERRRQTSPNCCII